jgi:8-oxo-dGTP pyrophosphatase MutT (NUDIX family)
MIMDNTNGFGSLDKNNSKDSSKKIHLDFFHEDMNSNQSTSCSNCGKIGHLFYQCKLPITSYGIILFRFITEPEFLMIRRKDSFGYIDFIRGKYSLSNIFQIQKCIDEMSVEEKNRIINKPFEILWKELWGVHSTPLYRSEETSSSKKFEALKSGIMVNDTSVTLNDIVSRSSTNWKEQEWEFPKGRRNYKENDMECAFREFEEETGMSRKHIRLVENIIPYEEYFVGSNFKAYKHKFYLAYTSNQDLDMNNYQRTEVSRMQWMTMEACIQSIRPYNLEKQNILVNVNKMLKKYSFYS